METRALSILLVEDNPCDAEILEFQMRGRAHRDTRIERVKRLGEALKRLDQVCYDLILLDLTLPDAEGLDAFLVINEKAPELPIVILTGLADTRLALETMRRGAQDYLIKDEIDGRGLLRALNHAIERKKVQQEAMHLRLEAELMQRRKSEFMAMMSHELRNPLTGIVGFAHLLSKTKLDGLQKEYIEAVGTSARALRDLLNNLLDLSSAEAGHVALECQPLDLRDCLEKVACSNVPQARTQGLEIVTHIDPEIPDLVMGDALRIRQVVENLLSNALKFTDQGFVIVSAGVRAAHGQEVVIRIVVEDSGRGISEDQCKSIFQPFRQAERGDRSRGKGLGLAICQQLIQSMGGVLGVCSQPGIGTGFWFDLAFAVRARSTLTGRLSGVRAVVAEPHPRALQALTLVLRALGAQVTPAANEVELTEVLREQPTELVVLGGVEQVSPLVLSLAPRARWLVPVYERRGQENAGGACFISRPLRLADLLSGCPKPTSVDKPSRPKPTTSQRLLIVDDDPVCRHLVSAVSGADCENASSAEEALNRVGDGPFQMLILDRELPDRDGLELAQEIRSRGLISEATPIVVISGSSLNPRDHELDGFLSKPVDPDELAQLLRSWLVGIPCINWQVLEDLRKYQGKSNPNLIRELVYTFLQAAPARISALERSRSAHPEETRRLAHQLRGAATALGAAGVAAVTERLEKDPRQPRVVLLLLQELKRSVEELEKFLDEKTA